MRLYYEKRKEKFSEERKRKNFVKGFWLDDINSQTLVSHIAVLLIFVVLFSSTAFIVGVLTKTDGSKFGFYPYNVMFFLRLISAPIAGFLILGLFHLKKNYIKAFIEEFISIYF